MAPASKEKKVSRITIACNACRSRKQKCSGEKPVCTQCLEYRRPCNWPEQLRRGPAKGYIEQLEIRLHETENILLQLLSEITDDQLSSTLSHTQPKKTNGTKDLIYMPFSRLRKQGVEYWKKFPLNTTESIREWQQDCTSDEKPSSIGHELRQSHPVIEGFPALQREERPSKRVRLEDKGDSFTSDYEPTLSTTPHNALLSAQLLPTEPAALSCSSDPSRIGQGKSDSTRMTLNEGTEGRDPHFTEGSLLQNDPKTADALISGMSHKPNLWSEAPPINFQQQFLW